FHAKSAVAVSMGLSLHGLAKTQWIGDAFKWFPPAPGANDGDGPISKDSTQDALVHLDVLDFCQIHLDRSPPDDAGLDNDPLVGNRKLGSPILDPGQKKVDEPAELEKGPDQQGDECDDLHRRPVVPTPRPQTDVRPKAKNGQTQEDSA